jgi:hypothetical protein
MRVDSVRIAAAVAPVMRGMIRGNGIDQDDATLLTNGAAWNPLLKNALIALDSSSISRTPIVTTPRFNVFSVVATGDSIAMNIGVTHCDGARFSGASEWLVVKRNANGWNVASRRFSGSGHGKCGG